MNFKQTINFLVTNKQYKHCIHTVLIFCINILASQSAIAFAQLDSPCQHLVDEEPVPRIYLILALKISYMPYFSGGSIISRESP